MIHTRKIALSIVFYVSSNSIVQTRPLSLPGSQLWPDQQRRTPTPRRFSSPPQSGQASCCGRYVCTSRRRCSSSGRRTGRATAFSAAVDSCVTHSFVRFSSSSPSRSSSCSLWRTSFSEERPRRNLAIAVLNVRFGHRVRAVARLSHGVAHDVRFDTCSHARTTRSRQRIGENTAILG
jgi:hypothetical protein